MKITTPLTDEVIEKLHAGDAVEITGTIYVARDAAHKRLIAALDTGEELPFDSQGQIIYYMGPSPARPGRPIGSAGPTTSYRMDPYTPRLLEEGLKGMIGKGNRSPEVQEALKKRKAVYFAATGGAAALIADSIKEAEIIAYEDLGAEALQKLRVEDFPVIVVNDIYGGDAYEEGKAKYRWVRESGNQGIRDPLITDSLITDSLTEVS
jgi:fumarate hydratase subunit beta